MTGPAAVCDNAACPRCGAPFRCGIGDAGPCACTAHRLSADMLAALGKRYAGCLCGPCLASLAQADHDAAIAPPD